MGDVDPVLIRTTHPGREVPSPAVRSYMEQRGMTVPVMAPIPPSETVEYLRCSVVLSSPRALLLHLCDLWIARARVEPAPSEQPYLDAGRPIMAIEVGRWRESPSEVRRAEVLRAALLARVGGPP